MRLTLKLRFHTEFGQTLSVTGDHPAFGNGDPNRAVPLRYLDHDYWQVTLELGAAADIPAAGLSYSYLLRQSDGSVICDWGGDRSFSPALVAGGEGLIVDSWNAAGFAENAFYTVPFRQVLLREHQTRFRRPATEGPTHTFRVRAPLLGQGQTLALLGGAEAMGNWDATKPVLLERLPGESFLSASLDLRGAAVPLEYKYAVFDLTQNAILGYEGGSNRRLTDGPDPSRRVILNDGFAVLPAETWKGAGVAIPVFSLRTRASFGIGEFTDLELLADWCRQTRLKLIQILPVNDTTATHTWEDSYPYSAISAFALHPIYLNLSQVANERHQPLLRGLEAERLRLNSLPEVAWEAVLRAKLRFIDTIYPSQKTATFRSAGFREFFAENQHWLGPYAAFCWLRDRFGTADAGQWPEHQRYDAGAVAAMSAPGSPHYDAIALHYFIQFHLHTQLRQAVAHAHEQGIVLKGDIPIGVSRHGADTWQAPELYDLTMKAGAPPDPFAARGQNWGFPTYNWPLMMRHGFGWWKQRFAQMAAYFDAFRIDHILGFFRIWSVPIHAVEGILGRFVPAIPLDREEFLRNGVVFDRDRLVEPFINEALLVELFAEQSEMVKPMFLRPAGQGRYSLLPGFSTQRQVERYFAALQPTGPPPGNAGEVPGIELSEEHRQLRQGLFDLISNVILLEVEESGRVGYHFRFEMEKTASFRWLDQGMQARLRELCNDYFYHRQDRFWRERAMEKLPALKRVTAMLICGEDLGVVPACVPGVMRELGLLSLEIQRMPKVPGQDFASPAQAPYLSVVTPSTHDMSTIRGWWSEDRAVTQRFYQAELGLPGPAPETCSGALNEAVVKQHLASPAMWSIFQIQDLLGMDESLRRPDPKAERINVPAVPRYHWRYRLHLTIEELLDARSFNQRLATLIQQSGR